jgi:hypothetical protein
LEKYDNGQVQDQASDRKGYPQALQPEIMQPSAARVSQGS